MSVLGMELEQFDELDANFAEARKLFINNDDTHAAIHGLFLNQMVAGTDGMHPSLQHSQGASIENPSTTSAAR